MSRRRGGDNEPIDLDDDDHEPSASTYSSIPPPPSTFVPPSLSFSSSSSPSSSIRQSSSTRRTPTTTSSDDEAGVAFPFELLVFLLLFMVALGVALLTLFSTESRSSLHSAFGQSGQSVSDTRFSLRISLESAYGGHRVSAPYPGGKQLICDICGGKGAESVDDIEECVACGGKGTQMIRQQFLGFIQQMQRTCPLCGGNGKIIKNPCKKCHGKGVYHQHGDIEIPIPRGVPEGHIITIKEGGHQLAGYRNGDVHIEVRTNEHSVFRRDGDDLHITISISLREALLGFKRIIPHIDGHSVTIDRTDQITSPTFILTIPNEGMPIFQSEHAINPMAAYLFSLLGWEASDHHITIWNYGQLFIHFDVDYPKQITEEQKDQLRRLLVK